MKQKTTKITGNTLLGIIALLAVQNMQAQRQTYKYNNGSEREGYRIVQQNDQGLKINFSINQFSTVENTIDGEIMQHLSVSGMFLPNEAGYPDLPGNARCIAIPQGSKAALKVLSYHTDTIRNIDIAPAPVIPLATDDSPLRYAKNNTVYSTNAFYPAQPVLLLEQTQIRGVDVVLLGITPFQYNPVTKDLIVYKEIKTEIHFEGGNGHFGNDAYRSRWWDPILEDHILNYKQLPVIDYNGQNSKAINPMAAGCEYAILIPNAPEFSQWADSVKKFRTEQGILTEIYKLSDIGSTSAGGINTWVANAYNNWTIKPAAMLILADYGTNANTTFITNKYSHPGGYPDFASDNYYADVTNDDLPDIAFSRIVANNPTQLKVLCSKFLNYERNPPTDSSFYNKPLTAIGWQDDRWFQVCGEIVGGYLKSIGKTPARVNATGYYANNTGNNVPNTGTWSTASNTTTVIDYFGQSGLKYIPDKPGTLGGFSGGTSTGVNAAINSGAFMVLHRDHGTYSSWGDPYYTTTSVNSLSNVSNKLPFVFSINCQTGAFHRTSECLGEKFHRYTKNGQNSGALGLIADAEISYSFYNDVMVWGMMDNMWPDFMPAYGITPASASRDMRPAFANVSAKYFLKQSSWCGTSMKQVTYQLYHMFGDAFQWFYSEVPQNLTVVHDLTVNLNDNTFTVTADAGSLIAITTSTPAGPIILGTAAGTGSPVTISLAQPIASAILVTVTKQNYFRYSKPVSLGMSVAENGSNDFDFTCYPNPFSQATTISYSLMESSHVTLSVYNLFGEEVAVVINNKMQQNGVHKVEFANNNLAAGVYSFVLKINSRIITKNIVIKE